jgi:hypothetical protein
MWNRISAQVLTQRAHVGLISCCADCDFSIAVAPVVQPKPFRDTATDKAKKEGKAAGSNPSKGAPTAVPIQVPR